MALPLVMLAALAIPLLVGAKKSAAPGATTPGLSPVARAQLFENKAGLQYWRTAIADRLLANWQQASLVPVACPAELGAAACYELRAPGSGAAASVVSVARSGLVVLVSVGCAIPAAGARQLVVFAPADQAQLATRWGAEWGIFVPSALVRPSSA